MKVFNRRYGVHICDTIWQFFYTENNYNDYDKYDNVHQVIINSRDYYDKDNIDDDEDWLW